MPECLNIVDVNAHVFSFMTKQKLKKVVLACFTHVQFLFKDFPRWQNSAVRIWWYFSCLKDLTLC